MPENIKGDWIWTASEPGENGLYVFFRKVIQLASVISKADFWISAHTSYHLYVNGRQIGYGPPPASAETSYAELYDLSYYLETGANVIAVLVHSNPHIEFSSFRKRPGLWCQLNIDETPLIWSDKTWRICDGKCYSHDSPLRGHGAGYLENISLSVWPKDWNEAHFHDEYWKNPEISYPINSIKGELRISPLLPLNCENIENSKVIIHGQFQKKYPTTHVSFSSIGLKSISGEVFAAETYIYSEGDLTVPLVISTDNSLKMFVNGEKVIDYSVPEFSILKQPPLLIEPLFSSKNGILNIEIPIKKGWNRIFASQECVFNKTGFFIIFPSLGKDDIKFFVGAGTGIPEGWLICGPLKLPYEHTNPLIRLDSIKKSVLFSPSNNNINDISSYWSACSFEAKSKHGDDSVIKWEIKEGEYIIIDYGEIYYGFPTIEIEGSSNDIIDVYLAEHLANDSIEPFDIIGRNSCTIVVSAENDQWSAFRPCGMRYLLIAGRKISSNLKINSATFTKLSRYFEETVFNCSDQTLNNIWQLCLNTLKNTATNIYMDAPGGQQCQYLADAMIQSFASAYSFGNYELSIKAVKEFMEAQYENGFIPSLCPGGFYSGIIDFSFLWPLWLGSFIKFSGMNDLYEKAIPGLENMLLFFKSLENEETGLISDIEKKHQLRCLFDYNLDANSENMITALNCMYCRTLLSTSEIFEAAGYEDRASEIRKSATEIAKKIRESAWDKKNGIFSDTCEIRKHVFKNSVHTNILAIFGGVATIEQYEKIFLKLFTKEPPYIKNKKTTLSPYFSYFIIETFFSLGYNEWAVDFIKHYWTLMLKSNLGVCTPFFPDLSGLLPHKQYICYGSGASPNIFIIKEIAGIRPAEPGFRKIYFSPLFNVLHSAKISLSTPNGKINIKWETKEEENTIDVEIDSGFIVEVAPLLSQNILEKCTFALGKNVTILDTIHK